MPSPPPEPARLFVLAGASLLLVVLRDLLEEEGYAVTGSTDVAGALDRIAAARPQVLVIEMVITREDRWDLLERLRADAATATIPVLLLSTTRRLLDRARGRPEQYGGEAFIGMPFDIADLLRAIRDLLPPM